MTAHRKLAKMRGHRPRLQGATTPVDDVGGVKEISPRWLATLRSPGVVESLRNARRRRARKTCGSATAPARGIVLRGSIDAATRSGSAGQRPIDNQEQNGSQY